MYYVQNHYVGLKTDLYKLWKTKNIQVFYGDKVKQLAAICR